MLVRFFAITVAAAWLGAPNTLCSAAPPDSPSRPNVIVILMDDVGRDKLALYGVGNAPPPTPNIDQLAREGVVFETAWAYQACSPTRAALLTGRYANRTGIGDVLRRDDGVETPLQLSEHILPEDLPGYRTATIGKWHLGDRGGPIDHPLQHGFDSFVGWQNDTSYYDWVENANGRLTPRTGYLPAALGAHAYRTIHYGQDPFFLYYCPLLSHAPFHRPPSSLHSYSPQVQFPIRQHKAMTESFDTILGRVLAHVDLSNTYVFLIGDNGSPNQTVVPPFDRLKVKGSLYEGGVHVPMIVAGPGIPGGTRCDELIHVTDIFATVRDLCGFGPPTQGAEDSLSFAPLLSDPSLDGERAYLFLHRFPHPGQPGRNRRAIRTKRWKLIEDLYNGDCELYDLVTDPFEEDDLLLSQPGPLTAQIKGRLLALIPDIP